MSLVHKNTKLTIDGVHKINVGGDLYTWNSAKQMEGFTSWSNDANKSYTTTFNLSGSNWYMTFLRADGTIDTHTDMKVVLDDKTSGGCHIEYLLLGDAGSNAHLNHTYVEFINAYSDGADKLTLGDAGARAVQLGEGNDVVKLGAGYVDSLTLGDGNDKLTMGSGSVQTIGMGAGNDTLTLGSGDVEAVATSSGNDIVNGGSGWTGVLDTNAGDDTVNVHDGGIELIRLSDGNNTLNHLGSGYVNAVVAFDGDDTVNIQSTGGIGSIALGDGNNVVNDHGSAWIDSIQTYDGDDTVTLSGTGGVGSVRLGGGTNSFAGGTGFVDTVFALDGDDTVTLAGGAWAVLVHAGNNTVTTGDGFVNSIVTDVGDDTITTGTGGVGSVISWGGENDVTVNGWVGVMRLGGDNTVTINAGGQIEALKFDEGNDTVSVAELDDDTDLCVITGGDGAGVDTVSFAAFTHSVDVDLGSSDIADTGHGRFIVAGFEKLIGGSAADTLEGQGEGGQLTGGGGADTFVFAEADGDITVTDFSIAGGDKIDLSGLTGIDDFADLSTNHMSQNGADTEIISGNGDVLVLENITKGDLTAGQFAF